MKFSSFTEAYDSLLKAVYICPEYESSPRGMKVKENLCVRFEITNPLNRIPQNKGRNWSVSYCIAELIWYLSGNSETAWISNYSSFWSNISDDGTTANSAYGARIFLPHERIASKIDPNWTQWDYVLNELSHDHDSRRAVIHIRTPSDSILAKKDVPCTLTLQFFLRDDALNLAVTMRSTDLIFGLGYDVPAFTIMQELMAKQLSVRLGRPIKLGSYIHVSNSLHIYEKHFKMVEDILKSDVKVGEAMSPMPTHEPPSKLLMSAESIIRSCNDVKLLHSLTDQLCGTFHPYYADWIYILAAHRAKKIGSQDDARALLEKTSSECYRFDGVAV